MWLDPYNYNGVQPTNRFNFGIIGKTMNELSGMVKIQLL